MDHLPTGKRHSFQSPPFCVDGISSFEVHVIGCDVAQGLVVASGVVVVDKDGDFPLPLSGCLPDNEVNPFLAGTVIAFGSSRWSGDDRVRPEYDPVPWSPDTDQSLGRSKPVHDPSPTGADPTTVPVPHPFSHKPPRRSGRSLQHTWRVEVPRPGSSG